MNNMTKKRIMAIFIGVVMLASIAEVALLRNNQTQNTEPAQLPNVINRKLTITEMRSVLLSSRALIEYFYNESCSDCAAKEALYQEFANSDNFNGYVVVSYGVYNETSDWLLDLTGTQTDLTNITTQAGLKKMFCDTDISTLKPNVCLL
ncbi:MAG: hypothetical protein NTU57_00595 [Candidatus Aenigmarchaeota archaeon]|nr:hypothetical protein [Candidatus Aenigmarchaeota archaeon]